MRNSLALCLLWLIFLTVQGCYVAKQGYGQLNIRLNQIPLEEAIEVETDERIRTLLAAVPKIKGFAVTKIGLNLDKSYNTYYATPKTAITFVVTAAKKTELKPHTWWFPILGSVPYKGFFKKSDAVDLENQLKSQGYDTWLFEAVAYSTLGWFEDPITTPMLRRGYFSLAETIIHEMTHGTLYVKGQGRFNEQLASFVGQQAAFQYFRENKILAQAALNKIKEKQARKRKLQELIGKTYPKLEMLYKSDISIEEKLQKREKLFTDLTAAAGEIYPHQSSKAFKFNNARILQYRRYEAEPEKFKELWKVSRARWDLFWINVRSHAYKKYNYTN